MWVSIARTTPDSINEGIYGFWLPEQLPIMLSEAYMALFASFASPMAPLAPICSDSSSDGSSCSGTPLIWLLLLWYMWLLRYVPLCSNVAPLAWSAPLGSFFSSWLRYALSPPLEYCHIDINDNLCQQKGETRVRDRREGAAMKKCKQQRRKYEQRGEKL